MIKRRALAAGLDGAFAGHSLRAGFATEGYAQGTPELAIMRHGRWRSASVMRAPRPHSRREMGHVPGERHKPPALEILPALGRVSDITADNTSTDRAGALKVTSTMVCALLAALLAIVAARVRLRRVGAGTAPGAPCWRGEHPWRRV